MHVCNKRTSLEISLTSKIKSYIFTIKELIIEIITGTFFFLSHCYFEYQISLESNDLLLFSWGYTLIFKIL